jgi:hypothetical protein
MKRFLNTCLCVIALLFSNITFADPTCSADALMQAKKLLNFHSNGDDRIEIMPKVKEVHSILNPADKKQKFQVLEVWGYIYKGTYRMHLIYYPLGEECVLMGQEILEIAKL